MTITRIAPHLVLALAVSPFAALQISCDGNGGGADRAPSETAIPAASGRGEQLGGKSASARTASRGLASGRHSVFGLRMPQGTLPAGTPMPDVYRFESPHPAALVEAFLTTQLASFDPAAPEASAKLYRNAVVRRPVGGAASGPLAIRVHEKKNGAAVDVWMERKAVAPSVTPGAGGTGMDAMGTGFAGANEPKQPGRYGTTAERRRAVFEMLQKVERGEPLSKEDLNNPLFQ
jgi:hypothetical protein